MCTAHLIKSNLLLFPQLVPLGAFLNMGKNYHSHIKLHTQCQRGGQNNCARLLHRWKFSAPIAFVWQVPPPVCTLLTKHTCSLEETLKCAVFPLDFPSESQTFPFTCHRYKVLQLSHLVKSPQSSRKVLRTLGFWNWGRSSSLSFTLASPFPFAQPYLQGACLRKCFLKGGHLKMRIGAQPILTPQPAADTPFL